MTRLPASPREQMVHPSGAAEALARGIAYLESAQLPSGEIPIDVAATRAMTGACVREPVVFPAALAARALAHTPAAADIRSRALDFLLREMEPGGLWRHPSSDKPNHHDTPLDLDDTALASAALVASGRRFPDNRATFLKHRRRDGLFLTWIVRWWPHPLLMRRFFRYVARPGDVDAVINANVVAYLGDCEATRPAVAYLLEVLRTGNEAASTIWYGSAFATWYFFSHALRDIAPEAGETIVARIEASKPADALEAALAAATLLLWNRAPDLGPLLRAQLPGGAWPSVGFYHMGLRPPHAEPKPPWWGSQSLTTVFAVEALSRYLGCGR